ncbi:hypothetical protein HQQ80_08250 [Microbacteriaceae bacterium VKM Ac-2855]|nr:hypothetical protein [Microbacteriaceae bacterium VKM Ac-2855]
MRSARQLILPLAAALLLTGCAPTNVPDVDATVPTASVETPTSAPAPEPTATATEAAPAPAATPFNPTCDDILTPEAAADLEATGFEPVDFDSGDNAFDDLLDTVLDDDGIVCEWSNPSTDATQLVAYAEVDAATIPERKAAVQAAGWVESPDTGGLLFTSPDPADAASDRPFLFGDSYYFAASSSTLLGGLELG